MAHLGMAVVGLSGGVDSTVTAWLLKQQGWHVHAVFMKNWQDDSEHCTSRRDLVDAVSVAEQLSIDIEVVDFSQQYQQHVFSHFLQQYQAGVTPNPDVLCNSEIKFKAFWEHAAQLGATKLATGHYARIQVDAMGNSQLWRSQDARKDQSYFLHRLSAAQLSRSLFPLGDWTKQKVRQLAHEQGFCNADRKDSTGICFIGERPFREFLAQHLPTNPGDIVSLDSPQQCLGQHVGLSFYTLGQRKGLQIGGLAQSGSEHIPWFVAEKSLSKNQLLVVQGRDHPALWLQEVRVHTLSWVAGQKPVIGDNAEFLAKIRHQQSVQSCKILSLTDDELMVCFKTPQWGVSPGQYLVLYQGECCLGGGVIARRDIE